jgi:hypothetical protein
MTPRLVAVLNVGSMPITDDRDSAEAKALIKRVEAVIRHARTNVYDPTIHDPPDTDPEGRYSVKLGPLQCTCFLMRHEDDLLRCLTIMMPSAKSVADLPPRFACAVIAKMFGFTGEMDVNYEATPFECQCTARCAPMIACKQVEPS